jgi:hypothetical protein
MSADLSGIDHVILGIDDLQKGIAELERATGVRAEFGGAHPGRGTQNALISLGGHRYLEILAPNPEDSGVAEARKELAGLSSLRPVGWAAHSEDLSGLKQRLGNQAGEIRPGARNRPDGSRLAWKTLGFTSENPLLPFFIEWDHETKHPSSTSPSGCRLTGFFLEDPAPDSLRETLRTTGLQVEVRQGGEPRIRISLSCPQGNVEF